MTVKSLTKEIVNLKNRIAKLERSRRTSFVPPSSQGLLSDQLKENLSMSEKARVRRVLAETAGMISKAKAMKWMRFVEEERKKW